MKYYDMEKEKSDKGNKMIFTIPSLDKEDIKHRYKLITKAVRGISKDISHCKKKYDKASEISEDYTKDYCLKDFEIRYAGKEKSIFLQTLETVQEDLNEKKERNTVYAKIMKNGAATPIPVVGEMVAHKNGFGTGPASVYAAFKLFGFSMMPLGAFAPPIAIVGIIAYGVTTVVSGLYNYSDTLNEIKRGLPYNEEIDVDRYLVKSVA